MGSRSRDLAARTVHRARSTVARLRDPSPGTAPPLFDTAPSRPVPAGWTEAEVRATMATFQIDDTRPGELVPYVDDALWRFLHTWGMVRDERGPALELGSNPYFITWLLREFTGLDLSLANYFDGPDRTDTQTLTCSVRGEPRRYEMQYRHFNLEEGSFPYNDATFRVVVFCEIIEHLMMDPLHALREIHRILQPGGLLVLTTPNVARLGNVLAMTAGANIYDPYSGFGPYGRHNREFTRHELHRILTFAGFGSLHSFTADAHPSDLRADPAYAAVAPLLEHRRDDLGQYVFVSARKTSEPRPGLPDFLYRSWPPDVLVSDAD